MGLIKQFNSNSHQYIILGQSRKTGFSMNKIKIINEQFLHAMQSSAKEFRVLNEQRKQNHVAPKRPKTPHEIFKSVIKQAAQTDLQIKRKERMHTTDMFFGTRTGSKMEGRKRPESPTVIEKKIQLAKHHKERPNTADEHKRRNLKMKTEKFQEKDDISSLKQDIDQVLTEIKQENQLTKQRIRMKYNQYGLKKFGKYWNLHKVTLDRKTGTNFHKNKLTVDSIQKSKLQSISKH